jgi:hypothetical protein
MACKCSCTTSRGHSRRKSLKPPRMTARSSNWPTPIRKSGRMSVGRIKLGEYSHKQYFGTEGNPRIFYQSRKQLQETGEIGKELKKAAPPRLFYDTDGLHCHDSLYLIEPTHKSITSALFDRVRAGRARKQPAQAVSHILFYNH